MTDQQAPLRWRRWARPIAISAIGSVALFLIVALLSNGFPSGSVHNPALMTLTALLFATLVTLYPLVRNFALDEDPLEPSVILGGLLFIYFPLPAFGISILGFTPTFPSFIDGVDILLPAFTRALVVISVGAGAMYVGYRATTSWEGEPLWPTPGERRLLVSNTLAIWVLSICIHLIQKLGTFSGGNALLFHLTNLHYLAVLLLFAAYFHSKGRLSSPRVLAFVLAVEISIVSVLGFNLDLLLTLVIFLALVYHYVGPGITYRKLVSLGALVVVLFPISEIVANIQSGDRLMQAFGISGSFVWYIKAFVGRMIGMGALTMIIARTPEQVPYQGGETLLLAIYGLVPRILWSGKPSLIMCGVNNRFFSGRGVDSNTCAAMTVPGELFWNFGAIGVVVGLLCVGLILGGLYRWFTRVGGEGRRYVLLVVYAIVLLMLMRFEWGVGQVVSNLVKRLGFAVVFLWFVTASTTSRTVFLDGDSLLEQSRFYRLGTVLLRNRLARFVISIPAVNIAGKWILTFPQTIATYTEASRAYEITVWFDRTLAERLVEYRSSIQNVPPVADRLETIVRHSMTYRLVSERF